MKKIAKYIGIGILVIIILFVVMIAYFKIGRAIDHNAQEKYVESLGAQTTANYNEQDFADFNLDDDIRLNEIQLIATHNSYKKIPCGLRHFLVSLYAKDDADELMYEHEMLTAQLECGVRSFELDIRMQQDNLVIMHVPLVDNRTWTPDFALALQEIKHWSDNNPDHVPLIIKLELKDDWEFLDPTLQPISKEMLDEIDDTIRLIFDDDSLLVPDDVRQEGLTLEQSILTYGWPKLQDVTGKVMFVMLPNEEFRNMYLDGHPSLEGRVIFTASEPGNPEAAVILMDEPNVEEIMELVELNYIVRTRADANLFIDTDRLNRALASGAQIISTDFPPNEEHPETGYTCVFDDGKTIRLNPVFMD